MSTKFYMKQNTVLSLIVFALSAMLLFSCGDLGGNGDSGNGSGGEEETKFTEFRKYKEKYRTYKNLSEYLFDSWDGLKFDRRDEGGLETYDRQGRRIKYEDPTYAVIYDYRYVGSGSANPASKFTEQHFRETKNNIPEPEYLSKKWVGNVKHEFRFRGELEPKKTTYDEQGRIIKIEDPLPGTLYTYDYVGLGTASIEESTYDEQFLTPNDQARRLVSRWEELVKSVYKPDGTVAYTETYDEKGRLIEVAGKSSGNYTQRYVELEPSDRID